MGSGVCGRCGSSACRGECRRFTDPEDAKHELVEQLGPVVDDVRDLYTQLGARSYRVYLVHVRWAGGRRGYGVEQVVRERQLLPTPKVGDIRSVSNELYDVGTQEVGLLEITQISPRYTENDLMGLGPDGEPIADDESFYWEVQDEYGTPAESPRRRFVLKAAPYQDPTAFEWRVRLVRVQGDRTRSGDPS